MSVTTRNHPLTQHSADSLDGSSDSDGNTAPPGAVRRGLASYRGPRDWRLAASVGCAAGSGIAFFYGWIGISAKAEVYKQLPYLISAGGVGIVLIVVALTFYLNHEHTADRVGIALVLERLQNLEDQTLAMSERLRLLEDPSAVPSRGPSHRVTTAHQA